MRTFLNPQNLKQIVIQSRLRNLDPFARVDVVVKYFPVEVDGRPFAGEELNCAMIDSTLTDAQINTMLSGQQTTEETQKLNTLETIKTRFFDNTNSAGLVGRNISTINNNTDRDALMKSVCIALGICDENGVILTDAINISGVSSITLGGNIQGLSKK